MTSPQPEPKPTLHPQVLLTYPRTASHLLQKILSLPNQPSIHPSARDGYFFLPTQQTRFRPPATYGHHIKEFSPHYRNRLMRSYQKSFEAMQGYFEEAGTQGEGKGVWFKEHVTWLAEPVAETRFLYREETEEEEVPWMVEWDGGKGTRSRGNETVLPDEVLLRWKPAFLIRHPALVFPSLYRTSVDIQGKDAAKGQVGMGLEMTVHWSRGLYDWYVEHFSEAQKETVVEGVTWPLVLDADDVMLEPEVVRKYAKIAELDVDELRFEWDVASDEQLKRFGKAERSMRSTIDASSGIMEGKTARGLDLEVEAGKWREEEGEEEGERIEKWVRDAMPDYEYMKERRLRR